MADALVITAPLLALVIVICFAFTGCTFTVKGIHLSYDSDIKSESSLIGYWRLGEAVGPTAKDELDPQGHDGSYRGGASVGVPGLIDGDANTAVAVDGASGEVVVPFDAALNPPKFSVEVWALPQAAPGTLRSVIASIDDAAHAGYAIVAGSNGTWQALVGDGRGFNVLDSKAPVLENERTYLCLTFDGATMTLWASTTSTLDAPPTLAVANFLANAAQPLLIAGPGPAAAVRFKGVLDEVALYKDALTGNQVANHVVGNGFGLTCGPPSVSTSAPNPADVHLTSATLRGTVNPAGKPTTYHFVYGETPTYELGKAPAGPDPSLSAGSADQAVSADVANLKPATTYHYRLQGQNSCGHRDGLDQILTTLPSTLYQDAIRATSGLLAYWRLDDSLGSNRVLDTSRPGFVDPTKTGAYVNQPTLGMRPGALADSGDNDPAVGFNLSGCQDRKSCQFAQGARLIQDNFSIEFWFNPIAPGAGDAAALNAQWFQGAGLVDSSADGVRPRSDFGVSFDGQQRVWAGTGLPDTSIFSPQHVPIRTWHHVVFTRVVPTRAPVVLVLYLDGASVATGTGGTQSLTDSPAMAMAVLSRSILLANRTVPAFFQGSIDEVAIYNVALTAPQVAQHHRLGTTT